MHKTIKYSPPIPSSNNSQALKSWQHQLADNGVCYLPPSASRLLPADLEKLSYLREKLLDILANIRASSNC